MSIISDEAFHAMKASHGKEAKRTGKDLYHTALAHDNKRKVADKKSKMVHKMTRQGDQVVSHLGKKK